MKEFFNWAKKGPSLVPDWAAIFIITTLDHAYSMRWTVNRWLLKHQLMNSWTHSNALSQCWVIVTLVILIGYQKMAQHSLFKLFNIYSIETNPKTVGRQLGFEHPAPKNKLLIMLLLNYVW